MNTAIRLLVSLSFALCLTHCDSGGNSSDGKSSWLRACTTDADCPRGGACTCGICTKSCEGGEECAGVPTPSACIETTSLRSGGRCKLGSTNASGICLAACGNDGDCQAPGRLECVASVCVPVAGDGRDAGEALTSSDGGGAKGAVESGGVANGGAPNDGRSSSVGDASTQGAVSSGGASNGGGAANGGDTSIASDAGTTKYPLSADDAPENPYGSARMQCENGVLAYSHEDAPCKLFATCNIDCQHDQDCPSAGSVAAVVACTGGFCSLECSDGKRCPPGMYCDASPNTSSPSPPLCMWIIGSPEKGCPGYCMQDPIPRDCPNWCAAAGVACDVSKNVNCCAGRTCGPDHYCLKG